MKDNNKKCFITLFVLTILIGCILVVVLVPVSFHSLEYYQYGFKRQKSTGDVDRGFVYGPGTRKLFGPDYEFKIFQADAHFEEFQSLSVYTADRLEVLISCGFQYFLRKHQLVYLHDNFDVAYGNIAHSNAEDALKGAATVFTTREYIRDRKRIEEALFAAVRERLGGRCCEKDCGTGSKPCVAGCLEYNKCKESDWGLFSDVRFFQLKMLYIPDELNKQFLQALILQEDNEAEKLKQQATIIRKETDASVQQTDNLAHEIQQNSTAESGLIAAKAEANSKVITEKARTQGLMLLYNKLGIVDPAHRASFDYLRSLRGNPKAQLSINYDQLISGAFK